MQLNLKLHIGALVNKTNMTYEQMVMFQGMNLHTQMRDHCDRVYGKGKYTLRMLTATQYHLDEMPIEGEAHGYWLKSASYERDQARARAAKRAVNDGRACWIHGPLGQNDAPNALPF
jgi:hypothetical protein